EYLTHYWPECRTLYDVLPTGARLSVSGDCLGSINRARTAVHYLSYEVVLRRAKLLADGLLELGLRPGSRLGIFSKNSPEYLITEHAGYHPSIVDVPMDVTLGPHAVGFIANQMELGGVFCDCAERVELILKLGGEFPFLKHIIFAHPIPEFEFG